MVFSSASKIQEPLSTSYCHQKGQHLSKLEACSTMFYNSSTRKSKDLSEGHRCSSTSTRQYFLTLTQVFSGGLTAEKSVGNIKYLATSSDYLRMSHCLWRESGGILCAFISEGRMFSMLKRLNSMTNKGKDYMITSNSFVFEFGNGAKNTFELFATRSCTQPACLDLGALATLSGSGDSKFPT